MKARNRGPLVPIRSAPSRLSRTLYGLATAVALTACTSDPDELTGTPAPVSTSTPLSSIPPGTSELETTVVSPSSEPAGSEITTSEIPAESPSSTPPPAPPPATEESCPLTAAQLSAATSIGWAFQSFQADQPLNGRDDVRTSICQFAAAALADQSGAPAVLRIDQFDATYAVLGLEEYEGRCTATGGTLLPADELAGFATCEIDGQVRSGFRSDEGYGFGLQIDGGNPDLVAQLVSPLLVPLLTQAQ